MSGLDFSILDKVRQRLSGPQNAEESLDQDTQVIENETQVIPTLNKDSQGSTQAIANATQEIDAVDFGQSLLFGQATQKATPSDKPIKLPQLGLDDMEFLNPELNATQIIPNAKEDENQSSRLRAEITEASLTDEENEMAADEADTTKDSSIQKTVTTKAELEAIQKKLSEEKRNMSIKPAFSKRAIDPVSRLVAAFKSDSEEEEQEEKLSSEAQLPKSSPTTSPIKLTDAKPIAFSDADSDSDFDTTNVLDILSKPRQPTSPLMKIKKVNPMETYASNLKRQIFSSPTRQSNDIPSIDLDDSSDDNAEGQQKAIPELTKDQRLLIKQRFAKKKLENTKRAIHSRFQHLHTSKNPNKLLQELKKANAKQLSELRRENGDAELIEEIEKEEEEMGTLLEREIERVRRIRKKEKLKEKAAQALLTGNIAEGSDDEQDGDYKGSDEDEEVPESDVDPEESDYGTGSETEDVPALTKAQLRKNRRVAFSDDEDDEESNSEQEEAKPPRRESDVRHDDSYMFGGHGLDSTPESEDDDDGMHIRSDSASMDQPIQILDEVFKEADQTSKSHKLFQNLEPRENASGKDASFLEDDSLDKSIHVPSFQELTETQGTDILPTQADILPSQLANSTQILVNPVTEQSFSNLSKQSTLNAPLQTVNEDDAEGQEDEEEEEEEEDEETLKQRLAFYEAKIRRKELKARRKRKELERRGVKSMVEGEAEESEDEWKGIGGADQDLSDQADSEDERMIDNRFNINLNDEEVRKKFMEQYQIKDKKELEKLIDDIQNHKLTKRARGNGFDIELSDEEDELLMAYRRQKLEEQKRRLLDSQKLQKLAKNDRAKAFFESIQDESISVALDEESDGDDELSSTQKDKSESNSQASVNEEPVQEAPKKVLHLEESFVQKKLSFLSRNDDEDYMTIQKMSRFQHAIQSDDEVEDLHTLKTKSVMNLFQSATPELVEVEDRGSKRSIDEVVTDNDEEADKENQSDDDLAHVFKKPSVVSSFRSFKEKRGVQVSSNCFTGVTVHKQYKVASGAEASITYLSKASKANNNSGKVAYVSDKAIRIKQGLNEVKQRSFSSKLFSSNSSFE